MTRKLSSLRTISALHPIDGADKIELAQVDGWKVIVKKGEYKVNDLVIYIEPDAWVPKSVAPFLCKEGKSRVFNNVEGERLKTIKMRGIISQGLILPANLVPCGFSECNESLDDVLGIQLWEAPEEHEGKMGGNPRGNFPYFIPKTDQERIQNCYKRMLDEPQQWQVTEKLDGSSITVYFHNNTLGVCSRNLDLQEDYNNKFWMAARDNNLLALQDKMQGFAIQGEMVGPGVQGNHYNLNKLEVFVYDIFDIKNQKYLNPNKVVEICNEYGLKHVPVIGDTNDLTYLEVLLGLANGESYLNKETLREGLVFKNLVSQESFKVISNEWLLKQK